MRYNNKLHGAYYVVKKKGGCHPGGGGSGSCLRSWKPSSFCAKSKALDYKNARHFSHKIKSGNLVLGDPPPNYLFTHMPI